MTDMTLVLTVPLEGRLVRKEGTTSRRRRKGHCEVELGNGLLDGVHVGSIYFVGDRRPGQEPF